MRLNTPHAVFTTEHCIAVGGHFFSFANLQDSFFGLIHAFCIDTFVTNTEHPQTRVLLFRMLQYLYKFYVEGADPISKCPYLRILRSIVIICRNARTWRVTPSSPSRHGLIHRPGLPNQFLYPLQRPGSAHL